jgi:hypothetical protein
MISNALVKLFFLNLNFFLFFLSPPPFCMSKAFPPFRFVLVHFSPFCKTWSVFCFLYFPTSLFLGPEPGAVMFACRRRVLAGRKTCALAGITFVTWGRLYTPCLVLVWGCVYKGSRRAMPLLKCIPETNKQKIYKNTTIIFYIIYSEPCGFRGGVSNLSGLLWSLSLSLSFSLSSFTSVSSSLIMSLSSLLSFS